MSTKKINNFFSYAIIFQTFILITVVISILFADFAIREYFIKDVKQEIVKIKQSREAEAIHVCQLRIRQLLKNINNCVVNRLAADPELNIVKSKEEFEKLVVRKVRDCQIFSKLTNNMRLYIYSKISNRVLNIKPRMITDMQKQTIQYRNALSESERKFIDRVLQEIEKSKHGHIWVDEEKRFLYGWDVIPMEDRGFEFYLPQFFSEPAKSMQYITIAAVPFTDMPNGSKVAEHVQYLQNKIRKFEIVIWIMRILAVIYILSQVTMILMEIKLRNILISEFGLRINNDST